MILHHVFNFFLEKNPKSDQNADFPDFWNYMVPYLREIASGDHNFFSQR